MANSVTLQTLHDGPGLAVIKAFFVIDTSDLAETVIADPATLAVDPMYSIAPNRLQIRKLRFAVGNPVQIRLQWKATANTDAFVCYDSADMDFEVPIRNNAGAGITGQLVAISNGWTAGTIVGSVELTLQKTN